MDVVLTIPPILITIIKKRCISGFFSYFFLGDKKNDIFLKKTKKNTYFNLLQYSQ